MLISWVNVLQILLAVLSSLLGFYLLSTRRSHAMTVFLFGLALHNLLRLTGDMTDQRLWEDLGNNLRFLYAPLVYFATRELLYDEFRYQPRHLVHLAPLAAAMLVTLFAPSYRGILAPVVGVLGIAYLAASYQLVWRFRRIIARTRSAGEPEGLRWLLRILHTYSLVILFEIGRAAMGLMMPPEITGLAHMLFLMVICCLLAYLVIQGLRRPTLLPPIDAGEQALEQASRAARESRDNDPTILGQLEQLMSDRKPYLNPQLNVGELAEALGIPGRTLSEVINDSHQCNFSEYINRARVEEARAMIVDPTSAALPLLDIGLAAGFNSKTSFNVMFKRYTGTTPSAYRRNQQAGPN